MKIVFDVIRQFIFLPLAKGSNEKWIKSSLIVALFSALFLSCLGSSDSALPNVTTKYGIWLDDVTDFDSLVVDVFVNQKVIQHLVYASEVMDAERKIRWDVVADESEMVKVYSTVWYQGRIIVTQEETFVSGQPPEIPDPILAPAVTFKDTVFLHSSVAPVINFSVQSAKQSANLQAFITSISWDIDSDGDWDTAVVNTASRDSSDLSASISWELDNSVPETVYPVGIRVQDGLGREFTFEQSVLVVQDAPVADIQVLDSNALSLSGAVSQSGKYGGILNYEWKFGDNSWITTLDMDTVHYSWIDYSDSLWAYLRISDEYGAQSLDSVFVIKDAPVALISEFANIHQKTPVSFSATASTTGKYGGRLKYYWKFGYGNWSQVGGTGDTSVALTVSADTQTVYLKVNDEYGLEALDSISVLVNSSLTDSRDGNVYRIIQIGTQIWMAENLNYTPASGNSWCYNNIPSYCETFGRLYDWSTAMNGSISSSATPSGVLGVCPIGWHLPSDAEWTVLSDFLGGEAVAAEKLRSSINSGSDNVGFSVRSVGYHYKDRFPYVYTSAYFWSATESNAASAWPRGIYSYKDYLYREEQSKLNGYSIRCLQDF